VRRLVSLCRGDGGALDELPRGWLSSIPRGAALARVEDWRRAISTAVLGDVSLVGMQAAIPILEVLAKGIAAAQEASDLLPRGRSHQLWQAALRTGPPDAVEFALQSARFPSENDAADSIAWCSARDLACAPRPYTRLLGLTNRGWPRRSGEDSILPDHVLSASEFDVDPTAKADRRHFEAIIAGAACEVVLSRSRRSAQGSRVGRSPLAAGPIGNTAVAGARPRARLERSRPPDGPAGGRGEGRSHRRMLDELARRAPHPIRRAVFRRSSRHTAGDRPRAVGDFASAHAVGSHGVRLALRTWLANPAGT
jgi:hypothetical protein